MTAIRNDVEVAGGTDGVEAHCAEMVALARRFGAAAEHCVGAAARMHEYVIDPAVVASSVLDPGGFAEFEVDLLGALDGLHGVVSAAAQCGLLDVELRAAAAAYAAVEETITRLATPLVGLWSLNVALSVYVVDYAHTHDAGHALQAAITAEPGSADALVTVLGLGRVCTVASALSHDGRGIAHASGVDRSATASTPPRNTSDIMAELAQRDDDPRDGSIDVRILTMPDGTRRVIVDLPGTRSWALTRSREVADMVSNSRELVGRSSAYELAVLKALHAAGVRPNEPVMLVGHSLGGMVAVTTARDARVSGQFNVTHVVTAGSPIGLSAASLPAGVQTLAFENRRDVVPHLDGRSHPDRANLVTASGTYGPPNVSDAHDLRKSYLPLAKDVQTSNNKSVHDYLASEAEFFKAVRVETHTFQLERQP